MDEVQRWAISPHYPASPSEHGLSGTPALDGQTPQTVASSPTMK
jgi:hypothetical protein